jgi:hypothetical protein
MRRHARTSVIWGAAWLAAGVALLAGCGGPQQGAASPGAPVSPAAQTLARVLAATRAADTVHISVEARQGPYTATYSSDAGVNVGRQKVTAGDGGVATILEVNGVGYFQANEKGLIGFLGTPQALARKYAGRWISFPPGGMGYQRVVSGVTLGAVADELELTGEITPAGKSTVDGQAVEGLTGGSPVAWNAPAGITAKLYVAANGKPLPVLFEGGVAPSIQRVKFSHWGEPLKVTAPTSVLPSSVLSGSQY